MLRILPRPFTKSSIDVECGFKGHAYRRLAIAKGGRKAALVSDLAGGTVV
jgi:hypothetical protein